MTKKIYNYLGKCGIEIDSKDEFHDVVERNIEIDFSSKEVYGKIKVEVGPYKELLFNKDLPYLDIRQNYDKDFFGIDQFRYGNLAKSIWKKTPTEYEAKTWLKNDDWLVSKLFKKIFYTHPDSKNRSLLHSSALQIKDKGILLAGFCRSGKTSLNVSLLDKIDDAKFLSEDEVFISREGDFLRADYTPGSVYARFSIFENNKKLEKILEDTSLLDALQIYDKDTIKRVIQKKKYDLDLGLNLSRQKFSNILGVETIPSMKINKIIFTNYSNENIPKIKKINGDEAIKLLRERDVPKDLSLMTIRKRLNIFDNKNTSINKDLLDGVELIQVSYDARKHLTQSFLEDLI